MFITQKGVVFNFSVCKEGFKMCILNTAVELRTFYIIYGGLPILHFSNFWIASLNHKLRNQPTEVEVKNLVKHKFVV